MPYVRCRRCSVTTYTAAWHVDRDNCPQCGELLVRTPSSEQVDRVQALFAGRRHGAEPNAPSRPFGGRSGQL